MSVGDHTPMRFDITHSAYIVPLVRATKGDNCPQAQVMRLVEGYDAAFGEVATTGVLDGAVWGWHLGLPYISPGDQTRLIDEIENDPLIPKPSAFELFVSRCVGFFQDPGAATQYESAVTFDRMLQSNPRSRSALVLTEYVAFLPSVNQQQALLAPPVTTNAAVGHGSLPLQDNQQQALLAPPVTANSGTGHQGLSPQAHRVIVSAVEQRALQRGYESGCVTLRTMLPASVSLPPGERLSLLAKLRALVAQDRQKFMLVRRGGVVRLGEALDFCRDDAHPVFVQAFFGKQGGPIQVEMLKVMELLTALKSQAGFHLHAGDPEPQMEELKVRLAPLLAIQAAYDCQRVFGAEGPKIVNYNTVRGWLGLEEVDMGKKRKQDGR